MTVAFGGSPQLRFPHFGGDWVAKRGGDAFDQRRERGEDGLPLYSVTIERGIVPRESLEREISSALEDEGNLRVRKDDLAYNMMRMWQGAVGRAAEEGMVSPAYVVLSPKPDTAPAFFEHWFKRARSLYLLWAYSYGLTNDRLRLYYRDFAKVPMALPSRDEQQKIADFLGAVDERIALLARKADALTRYRREVARRLFARQLRFRQDDGSDFPKWEEKKLGAVASFHRGAFLAKADIDPEAQFPCIHYGELFTRYNELIKTVFSRTVLANVPIGMKGDAIMPSSDVTPDGLARASALVIDGVRLGGDINIIRPKPELIAEFYAYWVSSHKKALMRLVSGTTVKHMYASDLKSLRLDLPHPDEQRRIANFLSTLDDKIDAVRAKIAAMQTFKKGLLQQMFV